jgi:hypothetical protein
MTHISRQINSNDEYSLQESRPAEKELSSKPVLYSYLKNIQSESHIE